MAKLFTYPCFSNPIELLWTQADSKTAAALNFSHALKADNIKLNRIKENTDTVAIPNFSGISTTTGLAYVINADAPLYRTSLSSENGATIYIKADSVIQAKAIFEQFSHAAIKPNQITRFAIGDETAILASGNIILKAEDIGLDTEPEQPKLDKPALFKLVAARVAAITGDQQPSLRDIRTCVYTDTGHYFSVKFYSQLRDGGEYDKATALVQAKVLAGFLGISVERIKTPDSSRKTPGKIEAFALAEAKAQEDSKLAQRFFKIPSIAKFIGAPSCA